MMESQANNNNNNNSSASASTSGIELEEIFLDFSAEDEMRAEHKKEAMARFHVGNFYINRKCTGALVGAHPFGGFNMSGTDSKAGGPDYMLQFLQAKTISEKIS